MMHPHIAAQGLASLGRKGDSTLVHMSPGEVAGLQKLALAHGGSLSINPNTGLVEAGFLSSILPMIAGVALEVLTDGAATPYLGYIAAGAGAADKMAGGSWAQALQVGMGVYGGGSLAAGLGAAGASAGADAAVPAATDTAVTTTGDMGLNAAGVPNSLAATADTTASTGSNLFDASSVTGSSGASAASAAPADSVTAPTTPAPTVSPAVATNVATTQAVTSSGYTADPSYQGLSQTQKAMVDRMTPVMRSQYLANLGTRASMADAYTTGSWAPTTGQGLSNMAHGIGTLDTAQGWGNLGSTMGKAGAMSAAMPIAQGVMNAGKSSNIPAATAQNEYYIQAPGGKPLFSPGTVNPNIAKLGYLPAGQEAFTGQGFNPGVYSQSPTQYVPVAATPGQAVITGRDGGIMSLKRPKKFDAGGSTVSNATGQEMLNALPKFTPAQGQDSAALSNMNQYFQNAANQASSQPPQQMLQPTPSPDAMNQYLAQTNQIITPPPPLPRTPIMHSTTPAPAPTPPPTLGPTGFPGIGQLYGLGYNRTPAYTWDPATNSWVQGNTALPASVSGMAHGGLTALAHGGSLPGTYAAGGKLLRGPGDGMSDDIPAVIHGNNPQRAALADGEFVIPADVVSHLGNGSTEAGSRRLYSMMDKVRHARTGNKKQGKQINPDKFLPA